MNKAFNQCLRMVLLVLCGTIVGINVYMANATSLLGNQMPMPFGYGAAVVLSGSMEPTFSTGDLILVQEREQYELNDIVVYQDGNSLVVHRIVEMKDDVVITQGDANNAADDPIDLSLIKGEVFGWIPYLGSIVSLIKTPVGTIAILIAAIALIEIPRRNEMKKDEEERQKIIDEIRRLKDEI